MRDPSELVWLDVLNNDFWWTNAIYGVTFELNSVFKEMKFRQTPAMTDSGTSCIYAPSFVWTEFIANLKSMVIGLRIREGYVYLPCDSLDNLPKISV